jgi:hypothetical protein
VRFASSSFVRLVALAAVSLAGTAATTSSAAATAAPWGVEGLRSVARAPGVRVVTASGHGSPAQAVDALERAGYHVDVAVLPTTFFVRPSAHASALPGGFADATPPESAPVAESAPSMFFDGRGDILPPAAAHAGSLRVRGVQGAGAVDLPVGLPYGARWQDTSEYMVGRVAVPILFPDSDGSIDPDHYDWTPALRDSVVRSAVRGFLKWTAIASSRGVPLTFLLEVEPISPTRYEPIDRPVADEQLWIEDSLEPLVGYRSDAVAMAYELANAARARLGTHWTALLFAVQNDTDPDGKFLDGIGEHAMLGGPYFVVMVKQSNFGSATLDFYIEHEMTHMFWALDEYPANNAWWACTLRTGYFDQGNTNSDVPIAGYCGIRQQCFMKGNYPDSLCAASGRQIGWVDLDGTGVLDLYETRPGVRPDSVQYTTGAGVPITVRGAAADMALPNRNPYHFGSGDSITIATVDSILHRVDGGPWIPVAPDDGIFDQGKERFTILLPSPSIGNHLLEFQARNSNGRSMTIPASAVITVTGGAGAIGGPTVDETALHPRLLAGPVPSAGGVRFSLAGRKGSAGMARLYDVTGREIRAWPLALSASGLANWEWDGRVAGGAPGAGGVYFLVVEIDAHRLTRRVVILH